MDTESPSRLKRSVFRGLIVLVLVTACALAVFEYRTKTHRPDLSISAADVAWATDYKIWKIDLSDAGTSCGLRIVVFENGGTEKRWLTQIGGSDVIDTSKDPVVAISAKCDGGTVRGRIRYLGGSSTFEAENLLNGQSVAWVGLPVLDGDVFYLMSDSQTVGAGKHPFEASSNKIALELLRKPSTP